ncbi:hypothetical protein AUK04_04150 [Candidatus Roizmanbacteria bacterium CG2_30_33_16]|uniref:Dinitrogenase iron-molybdenum cofactor biosynthesis domain-containing protein n=5 Tax=Candidatus Roizmaniibacteriota TaxID=1752723 RepID=A0A2M7BWQ6_9BACT|nr:hypothetical protein [Candidatus Roizmanbacteria bacterium]OIP82764.1 MAG: hypothetical protein AUK04_04150 [Candidatus Roizmanbacteria bacterium CG2_30_33_16]PIP63955.1 MAG: hypothetical protein COW96_05275 [Candidatus Roizmanbacteria bacterium CG22_combo_CG10-13_8_21_14_all_33_16]PIV11014.1 MAG: hypothetical protein COS50_02455 [Candidatus Roizmanbacteria bacterium CG03_land_8_20_14_0_80_35_26]PJB89011.1 MAG: hypothetical protein CO083_01465 [Candidatus Roizmanbacteria bacterium CG_4_9_14_
MKIAISSAGKNLESKVTEVFGRCPYFLVVEIDNKKIKGIEVVENTSIDQSVGAGISAAKIIAEKGADVVITGEVGPKALDVLKQFNIQVYNGFGSIKEVIQKFIDGGLKQPK